MKTKQSFPPNQNSLKGLLKAAYLAQNQVISKHYKQQIHQSKGNKIAIRKLRYQQATELLENNRRYYEKNLEIIESKFIIFWLMLCQTLSRFFKIRYFKLSNYFYLRFLNQTKQFTGSIVGEIWWKKLFINLIRGLFLATMVLIIIFPFYWMLSIAFRTSDEIQEGITGTLPLWPKSWSWGAFDFLFNNPNPLLDVSISKAIGVSFLVAILSTLTQTVVSLFAGFGLSHLKSRANEFFILILLATIMLPIEALLMGQYLLATKIDMKDTFPALFVPFIGNAFTIFMFTNAFNGINDSIKRAAKVDGISNFKFFWKIAIPLISSTIFTAMLISLISSWNAVLWPSMVIQQNKQFYTLPMILWQIINSTGDPNGVWNYDNLLDPQNLKMAASIVSVLPMFVIFVFTKKYLVKGITRDSGAKE